MENKEIVDDNNVEMSSDKMDDFLCINCVSWLYNGSKDWFYVLMPKINSLTKIKLIHFINTKQIIVPSTQAMIITATVINADFITDEVF